ncbi:MAG: HD domain-containing protein, partial [Desulfovibrionaceae bacterium]|nr:HD domain-containing protein [Desulfovibrionaceae bacterium]
DGFKAGATDFIRKPVIGDVVYDRVHRILEYEHLQKNLSWEVKRKTEQVEQLLSESQLLFREMATALAQAIDAKDKYTRGHSERVALYAKEIARRSGESEDDQLKVYYMGLFHDIGKIGVPRNILNKPGSLTEDEYKLIQSHSEIGYNILASIKVFPELAQGARFHHERFDGCGYPLGLKGEAIPKFARILSIADSYDAMTSKRSYRNSLPQATVRAEVAKGRGKQFDPRFADIMLAIIDADPNYELREKE